MTTLKWVTIRVSKYRLFGILDFFYFAHSSVMITKIIRGLTDKIAELPSQEIISLSNHIKLYMNNYFRFLCVCVFF